MIVTFTYEKRPYERYELNMLIWASRTKRMVYFLAFVVFRTKFGALIHLFFVVHLKSKLMYMLVFNNYLPFPRFDRMARTLIIVIWIPFFHFFLRLWHPFRVTPPPPPGIALLHRFIFSGIVSFVVSSVMLSPIHHSFSHFVVQSFNLYSLIHSIFVHLSINPFTHLLTHTFIHSFTLWSIHSLILPFM